MNKFFEVTVRYDETVPNGLRKVTETYLLDAVSFTEAEKRITERMQDYIIGEFAVVAERVVGAECVCTTSAETADKYYKVKRGLLTVDEKTGRVKKQTQYIIVQGASVDDARQRYEQYFRGSTVDIVLEAVSETKYKGYFPA